MVESASPSVAELSAAAEQCERDGQWQQAVQLYQRVLAAEPGSAAALAGMGRLAFRCGRLDVAVSLLQQAIAADPHDVARFGELAQVLRAMGDLAGTARCYEAVVRRWPNAGEAYHNWSLALGELNRLDEALDASRRAVELRPDSVEIQYHFACALKNLGRLDDAAAAFRRTLQLAPDHRQARFLLAAASGQTVDAPPPEYVAGLFDDYAARFDSHLVERLEYRVPQWLRAALRRTAAPKRRAWRVLDLGCGTGLCGAALADWAEHLAGVDLSPRMIEAARARGIYHELHVADALAIVRAQPRPPDLVVAADVLVYVGESAEWFAAIGGALGRGGRFAFSIETCAEEGFELRASARFAHSPAYVERLGSQAGLEVRQCQDIVVRRERQQAIEGRLYVMAKR